MMKLTILGCHSASPRANARTTSQLLELKGHLFLIDCGEGTQIALRNNKVKFAQIKHIFISHLHGDHFFGLPGLISTLHLLGRETELNIYAPKGAKEALLLLLKLSGIWTNFPLIFHELSSKESQKIFEDDKVIIQTIPLEHRIYTNGFLFQEKPRTRRVNVQAAEKYGVEVCYYQNIKDGKDVIDANDNLIPNSWVSFDPIAPHSYAFCSDTIFMPSIANLIKGVQVLYHESTFLHSDIDLAQKTKHSTAYQAAQMAQMAQVQNLILGHYSARYSDKNLFLKEAKTIFENTHLGQDDKIFIFQ